MAPGISRGNDATNQVSIDLVRRLMERLDRDEQELRDLRKQLADRPPERASAANPSPPDDSQLRQRLDSDEKAITNLNAQVAGMGAGEAKAKYPSIQFHGFGDLDYAADTRRAPNVPGNVGGIPYGASYYGEKNTFYMGELDLFITSQLAENTSILNETALGAASDNETGIDIERLYLEYRFNESFILDAGRFHTSLGYYNDTYHHGTWLQTAIGRPTFLQFEDAGGILPVRMVGLSLHGAIPSGRLNLNYAAELGNGAEYSANPNLDQVQQDLSFTDSKAVNFALFAKPDWLPGLQFGGNFYYDSITPDNSGTTNVVPRNDQCIFGAHAVYNNPQWEFLNEGCLIVDKPVGGQAHYNPAFYTQLARKFGVLTPYARFNYYKISLNDKLYTIDWVDGVNKGFHYGPSLGLRYDFTAYAAVKLQYDYLVDYGFNNASRINFQACFTF
ncbi:MAG TPA: hypothetical protein VGO59_05520 [Verrucomicrobiae bacterium]|jgi:hypothetical protein